MKKISFALALLAAISIVVQPVAPAYATMADEPVQSAPLQKFDLPTVQRALVAVQTLDEFILDAQIDRETREKLAHHAGQGEAAILSRVQIDYLARTNPTLHAKLMSAYRTMSVPNLTADEKQFVDRMTSANLATFKAGTEPGCSNPVELERNQGAVRVAAAGPFYASNTQHCNNSNNATGAWVVVALMLTLIIGWPLLCAILGNPPPFCSGVTQH
jgi:hypothetical protein